MGLETLSTPKKERALFQIRSNIEDYFLIPENISHFIQSAAVHLEMNRQDCRDSLVNFFEKLRGLAAGSIDEQDPDYHAFKDELSNPRFTLNIIKRLAEIAALRIKTRSDKKDFYDVLERLFNLFDSPDETKNRLAFLAQVPAILNQDGFLDTFERIRFAEFLLSSDQRDHDTAKAWLSTNLNFSINRLRQDLKALETKLNSSPYQGARVKAANRSTETVTDKMLKELDELDFIDKHILSKIEADPHYQSAYIQFVLNQGLKLSSAKTLKPRHSSQDSVIFTLSKNTILMLYLKMHKKVCEILYSTALKILPGCISISTTRHLQTCYKHRRLIKPKNLQAAQQTI